jgi:hypothetical protein
MAKNHEQDTVSKRVIFVQHQSEHQFFSYFIDRTSSLIVEIIIMPALYELEKIENEKTLCSKNHMHFVPIFLCEIEMLNLK